MSKAEDLVFPRRERVETRRKELGDRKLLDEFFDHPTLLAVSRLINQGQFDSLDHPISIGKEGGVFRATKGPEFRAVKVYRIGNTTFRRLPEYALAELRKVTSLRNFGGLISAWTRREHTILGLLTDAEVRVPRPYGHFRNVLVMEYVGDAEGAAPRLRDAPIDDPAALYEDFVDQVGRMVRKAKLVHGDLSPYNVLYFEDRVVLIDVAQAVGSDHSAARRLIERDIANFAKYFVRLGYPVEPDDILAAVGGDTIGPSATEV